MEIWMNKRFACVAAGTLVASTMLSGVNIGAAQAATRSAEPSAAVGLSSVELQRALLAAQTTQLTGNTAKLASDARKLAAGEAIVPPSTETALGWKQKLFVYALRHGGDLLGKFLGRLSTRAGTWVRANSGKLANFIDDLEDIAKSPIVVFLTHNGVPIDVADDIAEAILFFIG